MTYAGVEKRLVARLIDAVVIIVISTALGFLLGIFGIVLASVIISALYYTLFQGGQWHATIGQRALGIAVVDCNGRYIDYGKAAIRYLSSILSGSLFLFGYLMALFSDNRQTLHDKIADTYVVNAKVQTGSAHQSPVHNGSVTMVGITGEKAGQAFPIPSKGLLIGRDSTACQVVMKKTPEVSRIHCYVTYNPSSGMFILSDRGSTHGTFTYSGRRVSSRGDIALKPGEKFYLANKNNVFELR